MLSASLVGILIVLFLNFCFSGHALHQSALHRVKKLDTQKHNNFLAKLNKLSASQLQEDNNFNVTQMVYDYFDFYYYIHVTIGSNNQTFLVNLDTGSDLFWVPDLSCETPKCATKQRFDQDASDTYKPTTKELNATYGKGHALGFFGIDRVGFGIPAAFTVPACYIGQAADIGAHFETVDAFNGIIGLGPVAGVVDSPILQAYKQGVLPKPVFSIYLQRHGITAEGTPGGVVTWGAVDNVYCHEHVDYVPLLETTGGSSFSTDGHWTFRIRGICYGSYCNTQITKAFSDSGCSMIFGSKQAVSELWAQMGVNGTDSNGYGVIPCNADVKPLVLKIGRKMYRLPKEIIVKEYVYYCIATVMPQDFITDYWILGDPFIHQYCQIHDFGNKRIGFARSKQ